MIVANEKYNLDRESSRYKYAFNNIRRMFTQEQINECRENLYGISFNEAMTTQNAGTGDLPLSDFMVALFVDEITQLGLHGATARSFFPVVGQTSHSEFTLRYHEKFDDAQVLREGDKIEHGASSLRRETFGFAKIVTAPLFTRERLEDSLIGEMGLEVAQSVSKMYKVENRMMADQLCRWSSGTNATTWGNHIEGGNYVTCNSSSENDADAIIADIQKAFISLTAPETFTDEVAAGDVSIICSPQIYAELFNWSTARQYQLLGASPTTVTGTLPPFFGMNVYVMPIGYYNTSNEWVAAPCDIYLVSSGAAAIRERQSMRTEPIAEWKTQEAGVVIYERIMPYVRNPFRYRRISMAATYGSQIGDLRNLVVKAAENN